MERCDLMITIVAYLNFFGRQLEALKSGEVLTTGGKTELTIFLVKISRLGEN